MELMYIVQVGDSRELETDVFVQTVQVNVVVRGCCKGPCASPDGRGRDLLHVDVV